MVFVVFPVHLCCRLPVSASLNKKQLSLSLLNLSDSWFTVAKPYHLQLLWYKLNWALNLQLSSTFAGKFGGGTATKNLPNLKSNMNVNNAQFWLVRTAFMLSFDWCYFHTWNSFTPFDWLYRPFSYVKIKHIYFYKILISFME